MPSSEQQSCLEARKAAVQEALFDPALPSSFKEDVIQKMYAHEYVPEGESAKTSYSDLLCAPAPFGINVYVSRVGPDIVKLKGTRDVPSTRDHIAHILEAQPEIAERARGKAGYTYAGNHFTTLPGGAALSSDLRSMYTIVDGVSGIKDRHTPAMRRSHGQQCWVQQGYTVTRGHTDYSSVMAFLLPCGSSAVKLWCTVNHASARRLRASQSTTPCPMQDFVRTVACEDARVTVVLPGDIVIQPLGVWHTVCTGYSRSTDQYCVLAGHIFLLESQLADAYRYSTGDLLMAHRLAPDSVDIHTDMLLKPFWTMRHRRKRFDAASALDELRAELRDSGQVSRQHQSAAMCPRKRVLKKAQLAEARLKRKCVKGNH
jgi:hypothetical protein